MNRNNKKASVMLRATGLLLAAFSLLVLAAPAAAQHHGSSYGGSSYRSGHSAGPKSLATPRQTRSVPKIGKMHGHSWKAYSATHTRRSSGLARAYRPKYGSGTKRTHHYVAAQRSPSYVGARDSNGRIVRSEAAKREFMKQTGYPHGRPGYVVDHIIPLAKGGRDTPSNMQWQTIAEAKAKDKWERK